MLEHGDYVRLRMLGVRQWDRGFNIATGGRKIVGFGYLIKEGLVGLRGPETKIIIDLGTDGVEKFWKGHIAQVGKLVE